MSSNVGLSTPRGSGTSGYVQRNLSLLKPRSTGAGQPYNLDSARGPKQRKPDQAILTHDRLREIEVKVLELRDKLEEAAEEHDDDNEEGGLDDEAIEAECEKLRTRLVAEMEGRGGGGGGGGKKDKDRDRDGRGKGIKGYQVHELAEAKAKESEKLRRALGLKGEYAGGKDGDGAEHPMARQERRKREREMERVNAEVGADEEDAD